MVMDRLTDEVRQESPRTVMFADHTIISRCRRTWRGGGTSWEGEERRLLRVGQNTCGLVKGQERSGEVAENRDEEGGL